MIIILMAASTWLSLIHIMHCNTVLTSYNNQASEINSNTSQNYTQYAFRISIIFYYTPTTTDLNTIVSTFDQMINEMGNHTIADISYTTNTDNLHPVINSTIYFFTQTTQIDFIHTVNNSDYQKRFIQCINSETNSNISKYNITFQYQDIIPFNTASITTFIPINTDAISTHNNNQNETLWISVITLSSIIFCYISLQAFKYVSKAIKNRNKNTKGHKHSSEYTEKHKNSASIAQQHVEIIQSPIIQKQEDIQFVQCGEMAHSISPEFTFTATESNNDLYDPGPILTPTDDGETNVNDSDHLQRKIGEYKRIMRCNEGKSDEGNALSLPELPPSLPRQMTITIDGIPEHRSLHRFTVDLDHNINTHSYLQDDDDDVIEALSTPTGTPMVYLKVPRKQIAKAQW